MGSLDRGVLTGFICRLCSEMHRVVLHIYGEEGLRLNVSEKINTYLSINVSRAISCRCKGLVVKNYIGTGLFSCVNFPILPLPMLFLLLGINYYVFGREHCPKGPSLS